MAASANVDLLESSVRILRRELEYAEWRGQDGTCPWCEADPPKHADSCPMAAAVRVVRRRLGELPAWEEL